MGPLEIFLIVLAVLLVLYIGFFFYVLGSVSAFNTSLNKRLIALSVLLSEKKDVLLSLYALFDENGALFNSDIKDSCAKVCWLQIDKLDEEGVTSASILLSDLQKRLTLLFTQNEKLISLKDSKGYFATLLDLDGNYRRIISTFNADIIGYEYWRKMWLYSWCFFLLGFRKRPHLN